MRNLVQKLNTFFHSANPANTLAFPHNNSLTTLQISAEEDASTLEEANDPHDGCTSGKCICLWLASRVNTLKADTKPLEALEALVAEIHEAILRSRTIKAESNDDQVDTDEDLKAKVILEKVEILRRCVQYRLVMQAARSDETSTPPYIVQPGHFGRSASSADSSSSDLQNLETLDYFKPNPPQILSSTADVKQQPASPGLKPTFPYPDTSIPFSINHSMQSQTDLRNAMAAFEFDALAFLDGAGDHLITGHGLDAEHDVAMEHTLANIPHSMARLSEGVRNRISARAIFHRQEPDGDIFVSRDALVEVKGEASIAAEPAEDFLTNYPVADIMHGDNATESLAELDETLERVSSHLKDQVEGQTDDTVDKIE